MQLSQLFFNDQGKLCSIMKPGGDNTAVLKEEKIKECIERTKLRVAQVSELIDAATSKSIHSS